MYEYRALVRSNYDGDTVRLDIDLGFNIWIRNVSCRLIGVNTPELRGDERPAGCAARDALRALVGGREVKIFSKKSGKYGRWLVKMWLEQPDETYLDVNKWLVQKGYGEKI